MKTVLGLQRRDTMRSRMAKADKCREIAHSYLRDPELAKFAHHYVAEAVMNDRIALSAQKSASRPDDDENNSRHTDPSTLETNPPS